MYLERNDQANQSISKYKLFSSYGGPGSLIHTEYGSVIISCIEEWGFMKKAFELLQKAESTKPVDQVMPYVKDELSYEDIFLSNDKRFLKLIKIAKGLRNLKALVLIPNIEIDETFNTIKEGRFKAVASTFMPKQFFNTLRYTRPYKEWYYDWKVKKKLEEKDFFPPKYLNEKGEEVMLLQDNLVLICENGHISDFPWSKYLNWKRSGPKKEATFNPKAVQNCCNTPLIRLTESQGNASGYEGKYLKCDGGCKGREGVNLKGIFNLRIDCMAEKPWEVITGKYNSYFGERASREQNPPTDNSCTNIHGMRVALTTGNNLYFSRTISGIYVPEDLLRRFSQDLLNELEDEKVGLMRFAKLEPEAAKRQAIENMAKALNAKTSRRNDEEPLWSRTVEIFLSGVQDDEGQQAASIWEYDQKFRFDEYHVLTTLSVDQINIDEEGLAVNDVTMNLDSELSPYFERILRIDNLKVTTTQLDFTRVVPLDSDAEDQDIKPKNIFRTNENYVHFYPAVESFGEGIFFAFNKELLRSYQFPDELEGRIHPSHLWQTRHTNRISHSAIQRANEEKAQLYAVHTFSHLIMRELEFSCGYPTASLSERLYISNDPAKEMYGVLIMTTEGSEGSMGGLIAQTKPKALNKLIKKALYRATLCSSDPLCWDSEGQGLYELNLAACFSCALTSETSCEQRNIFLDRRILVDERFGLFSDLINK